jgi:2-hydroxychromene-2-carboxylate isomerase
MAERVDYFFSFRSPYSYISAPRAFELPEHWDIDLVYRGTIPMVMRGQAVSRDKGIHTMRDTKREADALGMPFGPVHDPVGDGAMRCLLVAELAADLGVEKDFVLSASRGIWAEAIDTATDEGLKTITQRAGLDWEAASAALANTDYAARLEANVSELEAMKHWGVPTFVLRGEIFWGQDRIVDLETRMAEYSLRK